MKIMSVATMAVLVGVGVCDGAIPQQDARRVTVCTARVASPVAFYQARTIASKMHRGSPGPAEWCDKRFRPRGEAIIPGPRKLPGLAYTRVPFPATKRRSVGRRLQPA